MNKRLSKYFASFDKSLFVLSATSGNISLASFATVIWAPAGIVSASFNILISTEIVKKLLKKSLNKNKNENKIVMLTRSKLNSIESKISEALRQLRLYDNY